MVRQPGRDTIKLNVEQNKLHTMLWTCRTGLVCQKAKNGDKQVSNNISLCPIVTYSLLTSLSIQISLRLLLGAAAGLTPLALCTPVLMIGAPVPGSMSWEEATSSSAAVEAVPLHIDMN